MSVQVTVTLADPVLERARLWARRTGRPVEDFLAEAIELSLSPLGTPADNTSFADLTDEQVLAAADATMPAADDRRLSELLDSQQAATLAGDECTELASRMQSYQDALLRKARAVREAVRRGLRAPVGP